MSFDEGRIDLVWSTWWDDVVALLWIDLGASQSNQHTCSVQVSSHSQNRREELCDVQRSWILVCVFTGLFCAPFLMADSKHRPNERVCAQDPDCGS